MTDALTPARLGREFFRDDTVKVARALVGKLLVRRVAADRVWTGRIVETEAYHGPDDRASHAHGGPTPRSAIMYGQPGVAYVYLIYGMYSCLNVVTMAEGVPAAVLLRALGPAAGYPFPSEDPRAAAGPGKLCRAFAIDRALNRADVVTGPDLWFADDGTKPKKIARGPRINIEYAGTWAQKPWRFWISGDPSVSKLAPKTARKATKKPPSPKVTSR